VLSNARRQLQAEAKSIADQIARLDAVLRPGLQSGRRSRRKTAGSSKRGGKRQISAAGRARIAAAQRKRWAKVKAAKKAKASGRLKKIQKPKSVKQK
jgi:hypothetical protein